MAFTLEVFNANGTFVFSETFRKFDQAMDAYVEALAEDKSFNVELSDSKDVLVRATYCLSEVE